MARIQILEISPTETPMEDLSYDMTGNITGGSLGSFIRELVLGAIKESFDLIRDLYTDCIEAGGDPAECLEALNREL